MVQRIVGVDIGDTALRAVEVHNPTKARPTVVRFHEIALPEGAVRSGEVIEQNTVATALRQLWSEGRFKTRDVVIGIGNQKVVARDLTVAHAPIKRIREALPFQVQDLIPVPVEDALLDFYPIAAVEGENGPAVTGLLIAAVKAAVEANVSAVRQAGLSPVDVDLIPFALLRALNHATEGTNAFIDIGAAATNVVLATNGVPQFVRIIPSGGDDLTRAIASRLSLEFDAAERVKRSVGLAPQDPEQQAIAQVIYEVSVELLTSLRNTLHFFANTRTNGEIQRVVLNGGGAYLPGFAALLQEAVRVPVEFGDPLSRVALGKGVTADAKNQKGAMTVALGLAIGGAA
ncbi:type IV pilus assembly protein PilM [Diaminobutyricimonas sp. LJ205]|uniref:type IV pilus assembly protein PilM n=1 Tax=Diaminobutyricimonas sp. LJ205 TaxID=2683590 RepID=UPI0012F4A5C4|nr:type IV pilus assembly protein PilM [Diaminobutyricimonas sp. LJ205]